MKMNLSVIVVFRANLSLIVFHDNPSGVFSDNPFVLSGVFRENRLVSSVTIRLFRLMSFYDNPFVLSGVFRDNLSVLSVVLCGSPLSYSEFFCVLLFVVSSSEDSLLLSFVAVHCLTLSSSVFFYSL
jgi:hypothetical protein